MVKTPKSGDFSLLREKVRPFCQPVIACLNYCFARYPFDVPNQNEVTLKISETNK